jgi:bacillithiol biosynthesis cysteine-adding enzyme BshC
LKSHCLRFAQIPHISALFVPSAKVFYPRSPNFSEWFRDEASKINYESKRREQVCGILERQNRDWGASEVALKNIERLRQGACALVTGQQVSLFGGPAFFLYKALSAVKLAEEASRAGVDCVPIFWLATQDHDLEEVNHVSVPGLDAVLTRISAPAVGIPDAPVANMKLGAEIEASINLVAEMLGESEGVELLRAAYRAGETFGSAFAKLFAQLFGEWGMILCDASDPELNAIAAPIYTAAIERAEQLAQKLKMRGSELEIAGYHQQVKVAPSATLLFALKDGARSSVQRGPSGEFSVGGERLDKQQLIERIQAKPRGFSANVLLRPVVQDYLLPTLAYTGGVSEITYFAQVSVVFETIGERVTPIVPQFSATVVEPKTHALLQKYQMKLADIIKGPEAVREQLSAQSLPPGLKSAFDKTDADLGRSLANLSHHLGKLDKTLIKASSNAGSKIAHQICSLRSRAARAELRHSEVLARHADCLSNLLFPKKALQDRQVGSMYFIGRYGKQFLRDVHQEMHFDCFDHQVLTL